MKKILCFLDRYLEEIILAVLLSLIAVIMLWQVIMRYAAGSAMRWPEEVCRYLYIWSCFIGISYCIRRQNELRIDLVEKIFHGKARVVFEILLKLICVVFYAYLAIASINVLRHIYSTGQTSPAARIPMYMVYLSMPVSFILAVFRGIQAIVLLLLPAKPVDEKGEAAL